MGSEAENFGVQESKEGAQTLIPSSVVPSKSHSIRIVHLALVIVQLGYAGLQMFSRVALNAGLNQFLLSLYRNMVALAILGPIAYYYEREIRPPMSLKTFGGLNLLSLTGVVGSQQLFLAGLQLTSPLMAAVSQNMIPVFTFLLAATLGFEEVNMRRREGIAKVIGTVICIGGAITMSVYKGIAVFNGGSDMPEADLKLPFGDFDAFLPHYIVQFSVNKYQLGIAFLLMNCISWSVYLTAQGSILRLYPALLSMTAATYFFGILQLGVVAVASTGRLHFAEFSLTSWQQIVGVLYAGLIASTINLLLQTWCVQKGGPFIVSLYVPLQMLMVAVLSVLLLQDTLYMGIVLGGLLTVAGFYLVVWGQGLERRRKRSLLAQLLEPEHDIYKVGIRKLSLDLKERLIAN
ncbi:WAT1-related protein At3g18200 [Physcomitrium patens]|uniref:WAT1-related protein n=1 Tax=Physcomitrium patens TaxID=3218 RepID=A0A2K1K095_PHYPA|nr:WAT1-related protein At3g18200-like [Physcomitrium patens]XP_024386246.1 WAT1-related protein At3g18200-like [Physcomitrium patens]PNR47205.1 hypothetical protein PHYPA_014325 [Physcomitrium patens]|eukprot:XP_024386245.1 WAT1-related protein At3g18200-like [Physcomitrella patens]